MSLRFITSFFWRASVEIVFFQNFQGTSLSSCARVSLSSFMSRTYFKRILVTHQGGNLPYAYGPYITSQSVAHVLKRHVRRLSLGGDYCMQRKLYSNYRPDFALKNFSKIQNFELSNMTQKSIKIIFRS